MTRASRSISTTERVVLAGLMVVWVASLRQARGLTDLGALDAVSMARTSMMVAGLALVIAGAVTFALGGRLRVGAAGLLCGLVTLMSSVPPAGATNVLRVAIAASSPIAELVVLLLVLLVLGWNTQPARTSARITLVGLVGASIVMAGAIALTFDAFYLASCAQECKRGAPMIDPGLAGRAAIATISSVVSLIVAVLLAVVSAQAWVRESWRLTDRALVALGGVVAGVAGTIAVTIRLVRPAVAVPSLRQDLDGLAAILAMVVALALVLIAVGVGLMAIRTARARVRVRRLAERIVAAPAPGSLGAALAHALDDPGVVVGYWLPDATGCVDAEGRPLPAAPPAPGRAITTLERHGHPVAFVAHRSGLPPETLTGELGPSLLLALDNERLRAARLARLRELRSSRERIVAAADAERRRVERDLHDGVQQQLLAIAIEVRLARTAASRAGAATAQPLADIERLALAAGEELRRIARGIYPSVLGQAGLVAALESLGEEWPVVLELPADHLRRLPESIEGAAYQVVTEMVGTLDRTVDDDLHVRVSAPGSDLHLEVLTPAAVDADTLQRIEDRVGAAGGEVTIEPLDTGRTLLRVELPCA